MRIIKGDFEGLGTYLFSRVDFFERRKRALREKKRKLRGLSREHKFSEKEELVCRLVGGHTAEKAVRTVLQEEAQFSRVEFDLEVVPYAQKSRRRGAGPASQTECIETGTE
eukprot:Gb_30934 [translate_table: standard]